MATTINKNRGVRFLVTRIITGAAAAGLFVSLWAGVSITASAHNGATASGDTAAAADQGVVEQAGWRWDPDSKQWVAIDQATPEAAAPAPAPVQQVIVIERQPVYYTTYVQQVPGGAYVASSGSGGAPTASYAPTDSGTAAAYSPSAPASAPSAPAPAPAAPVAAAPVAPPAPKPAAPPPAPKTTKAS